MLSRASLSFSAGWSLERCVKNCARRHEGVGQLRCYRLATSVAAMFSEPQGACQRSDEETEACFQNDVGGAGCGHPPQSACHGGRAAASPSPSRAPGEGIMRQPIPPAHVSAARGLRSSIRALASRCCCPSCETRLSVRLSSFTFTTFRALSPLLKVTS